MTYDVKVPLELKKEQQWFGSIIGRPIDENNLMNPLSPSGMPMDEEASVHIAPSPTLKPAERIQIYNQQYWWRLLNLLHDSFPTLTRLLGYYTFNQTIGFPFLVKYPPAHWSLNLLGDRLSQWIEEEYISDRKGLLRDSAHLDWAFGASFIAAQLRPLSKEEMAAENQEEILIKTLYLQPHVQFFRLDGDLFNFRLELLKNDVDYWQTHTLPKLESSKAYHIVLYRNLQNDISWKEISQGEYALLKVFKNGSSIEMACEWIEQQDESICTEAMNKLQIWFQEWTMRGWLSLENSKRSDDTP